MKHTTYHQLHGVSVYRHQKYGETRAHMEKVEFAPKNGHI